MQGNVSGTNAHMQFEHKIWIWSACARLINAYCQNCTTIHWDCMMIWSITRLLINGHPFPWVCNVRDVRSPAVNQPPASYNGEQLFVKEDGVKVIVGNWKDYMPYIASCSYAFSSNVHPDSIVQLPAIIIDTNCQTGRSSRDQHVYTWKSRQKEINELAFEAQLGNKWLMIMDYLRVAKGLGFISATFAAHSVHVYLYVFRAHENPETDHPYISIGLKFMV